MTTELRRRFEDYLTLQRLSDRTKEAYISAVAGLAKFYGKSPDSLADDMIQQYLLYLIRERKLAWSSCNVAFSGIHCFYAKFLKRDKTSFTIPPRIRPNKLPEVLSRKEVEQLIEAAHDIRHRSLLTMTYGSGLRVSELVHLKTHHIEGDRKLVRVEEAKGHKDRYTLLSMRALDDLRAYWKQYRPTSYVFYGRNKSKSMDVTVAQRAYHQVKTAAGIHKGRGIHTLRHCFATHLLEQGVDIYMIKKFLGHTSIKTTTVYLHLLPNRIAEVKSPLDFICR